MEVNKKYGYGSFGKLSSMYDKARKGMPDEVLDYLFEMLPQNPKILDLGCGTGIVTRQMKERGADITGADRDPQMLEKALAHKTPGIEYIEPAAKELPFKNEIFDAVTAFSAFHWFANIEALTEIERTMKPGGLFFIANRKNNPEFLAARQAVLRPFASENLPPAKTYDYVQIFTESGLTEVVEKKFEFVDRSSVEESVEYVQSTSYWNLIPEKNHDRAIKALRDHFSGLAKEGVVEKQVWIVTCCGRKN